MAYRPMFNSKKREALWLAECLAAYQAERTDGKSCICNLCGLPVLRTDAWDESHDPAHPKAFGGTSTGIAHRNHNREHGAKVVTPAVAKSNRIRRRAVGALGPGMGRYPMPGGRRSNVKRAIGGGQKPRLSLADKHAAFVQKRGIRYQPGA